MPPEMNTKDIAQRIAWIRWHAEPVRYRHRAMGKASLPGARQIECLTIASCGFIPLREVVRVPAAQSAGHYGVLPYPYLKPIPGPAPVELGHCAVRRYCRRPDWHTKLLGYLLSLSLPYARQMNPVVIAVLGNPPPRPRRAKFAISMATHTGEPKRRAPPH